jgi:hypothetical protein
MFFLLLSQLERLSLRFYKSSENELVEFVGHSKCDTTIAGAEYGTRIFVEWALTGSHGRIYH